MMTDHATETRQRFIADGSDPYHEKRNAAIAFLRLCNNYRLDPGSRKYTPANGRFPAAMVELRTSL